MSTYRSRSFANEQREGRARAQAWTTGCLAIAGLMVAVVLGLCCAWNSLGGVQ